MFCKKCGAQMPDDSLFCPECGAPIIETAVNKPNTTTKPISKGRKIAGRILLTIGSLCAITCIMLIVFKDKLPASMTHAPVDSASSTSSSVEKVHGINDPVTQDGITITLVGITEDKGTQFVKPSDGKTFLLCEYKIENNSTKDIAISSIMSFKSYVDDYAVNESLTALANNKKGQMDGTISSGKKMDGVVGYEIPSDWKNFETRISIDIFSNGQDIVFKFAK